MANNIYQKMVADVLGTRQIAFNPDLARITKSVEAGLLLSQLLYWYKKGYNPEWFYKTIEEIKKETYLTRSQQDTAIKKCSNLGLIEIKLMGIPRKRYFNIKFEKIVELLKITYGKNKSYQQVCIKQTNSTDPLQHTITESPQRLQTKNTQREQASRDFSKISDIINQRQKL